MNQSTLALFAFAVIAASTAKVGLAREPSDGTAHIRKIEDIVIYKDDQFYSAFPSIVRRPDGELLLAFRRAPDRRVFGETGYTHTAPNSYLVSVRSKDDGKTWTKNPELIFAHPFGGSQDPCMLQLRDGSILCASYGWALIEKASTLKGAFRIGNFCFLGGYIVKSTDGGNFWKGPIIPPPCKDEVTLDPFGKPVPAYNRGAMCEGKDGRLFWVVASGSSSTPGQTATHLMISDDKGETWKYSCPVGQDEKVTFNERRSKSEGRNGFGRSNGKGAPGPAAGTGAFRPRASDFFRISDFELRISGSVPIPRRQRPRCASTSQANRAQNLLDG